MNRSLEERRADAACRSVDHCQRCAGRFRCSFPGARVGCPASMSELHNSPEPIAYNYHVVRQFTLMTLVWGVLGMSLVLGQ